MKNIKGQSLKKSSSKPSLKAGVYTKPIKKKTKKENSLEKLFLLFDH